MTLRRLEARVEKHPLAAPFRISGYVFDHADVVVATISEDGHRGRGEAAGVYYLGDGIANILATIEANRAAIESGIGRDGLQQKMPAGGARNALDCALWELEASLTSRPAWQIAGVAEPRPLLTTFTIGADEPEAMAERAIGFAQARAIKLKLTGELDLDSERVRAVRKARPDVWIGVDANQGFARDRLEALVGMLLENRVMLLEQPLARGREADLEGFRSQVPIAADESALTLDDLPGLVGRFNVVNIKLDKCGGLTEGLAMAHEARRLGLEVMVGNMTGTSLAMGPAFILGQYCDIVDLDGPIFLAKDRDPAVVYSDGMVSAPDEVWGAAGRVPA